MSSKAKKTKKAKAEELKADLLEVIAETLSLGIRDRLEPKALASRVFETLRDWDARTDKEARKDADPKGYSGGSVNLIWDKKNKRFSVLNGKDFMGFMPYDNVMAMISEMFGRLPDGFKMEDINLGDVLSPSTLPLNINELITPNGEGEQDAY